MKIIGNLRDENFDDILKIIHGNLAKISKKF